MNSVNSIGPDFSNSLSYPQRLDKPAQMGLSLPAWWAQRAESLGRRLSTPWSRRGVLARQQQQVQSVLKRMTLVTGVVTGPMLTAQAGQIGRAHV